MTRGRVDVAVWSLRSVVDRDRSMSQWPALLVVIACLIALLALWLLRNYTAPWLSCVSRIAVSLLFGWVSLRAFAGGWEKGRLSSRCRGCSFWHYISIDQNPVEFVVTMSAFAVAFVVALGCLLYYCWWLFLIVRARFD